MNIIATSTGVDIANKIQVDLDRFPDGELHVRIMGDLRGEDVAIIGNTYPNDGIIELLLLIDAVGEMKPNSINVVIPYLGYGRQDRIFEAGEALSIRAICGCLCDVDRVVLIDPHSWLVRDFFRSQVEELTAIPLLARWMEGKVDFIVAPDKGSARRAEIAARELGVEYIVMQKKRNSAYDVEVAIESGQEKLDGQRVGIVDDIISTGGTMAKACSALRAEGAKEIYLACTHGLFLRDSLKTLSTLTDGIATTDSLGENRRRGKEGKVKLISLGPLITSIFDPPKR